MTTTLVKGAFFAIIAFGILSLFAGGALAGRSHYSGYHNNHVRNTFNKTVNHFSKAVKYEHKCAYYHRGCGKYAKHAAKYYYYNDQLDHYGVDLDLDFDEFSPRRY